MDAGGGVGVSGTENDTSGLVHILYNTWLFC